MTRSDCMLMNQRKPILRAAASLILLLVAAGAPLDAQKVLQSADGVVSAGQPLAAEAGARMLELGGNAVDAAVATAFALAVVEPSMSGLGGRAQIIIRTASGEIHGIDATTQAPLTYDPDTAPQARYGYPTVGIPGVPAGLVKALADFGTLPLTTVMEPAIQLAEDGFVLLPGEAGRHARSRAQLMEFAGSTEAFLDDDGQTFAAGARFRQPELAWTLRQIAERGHDGFYGGEVARRMAEDLQANGSPVTLEALAQYEARVSQIVRGSYRGVELAGLWMPSFGAITIHALQLLETVDLEGAGAAEWATAVGEALRVSYLERPFQTSWEDAERLVSKSWAEERSAWMRLEGEAGEVPAASASQPPAWTANPGHTTHLSAADRDGGMVALTQSLGPSMGSRVVSPGLGFLYAATTGGYLGRMEPGQRAASHISPFLLLQDGQPMAALGAAGGGRIPTAIVAAVSRMVDHGLSVGDALAAPRVVPITGSAFATTNAEGPIELDLEMSTGMGFSASEVAEIEAAGFEVRETHRAGAFGRIHAVAWDAEAGHWIGAADPDWEGAVRSPEVQDYDLVLSGGRVLDGSGNPWFEADVGIVGDRVAAVGDLSGARAAERIDVTGYLVTPGFIDTHSHAGPGLASEGLSHARPLLAQGVTTVFINPDGGGQPDLREQQAALLEDGVGVNVAQFVPHGSVRRTVMGTADRAATADEMDQMRGLVRAGMEAGAFGLSSGTFYVPGTYADNEELVELGKVVAEYGGAYTSHVRDESNYTVGVVAALEEVIEVAREAGIPGVHTHIKVLGPPVWGFSQALIHRIELARAEGVEVYGDQYPYPASATGLAAALLPAWSMAGGQDSLRARIADPETRQRISDEMVGNLARRGGADRIQFRTVRFDPSLEGRRLDEVAGEWGMTPIEASLEMFEHGGPSIVSFNMHEDDVQRLMRQPWTMTASDGSLVPWNQGVPHPRSYGAFTRKLETYVHDEGVVTLEEAIRSMTGLPAQVFRLADRGVLREGAFADIAVFKLEELRENATFTAPHALSDGMHWLLVNGEPVIQEAEFVDARAGRLLAR